MFMCGQATGALGFVETELLWSSRALLAPESAAPVGSWEVWAEALAEEDAPVTSAAAVLALPGAALLTVAAPFGVARILAFIPMGLSVFWTAFQVYTGTHAFMIADHALSQVEQATTNLISVHAVHAEHLTEEWYDGLHSRLNMGFREVEIIITTSAAVYCLNILITTLYTGDGQPLSTWWRLKKWFLKCGFCREANLADRALGGSAGVRRGHCRGGYGSQPEQHHRLAEPRCPEGAGGPSEGEARCECSAARSGRD
jgi:hypothetical protein